jgi:hypothetical protein
LPSGQRYWSVLDEDLQVVADEDLQVVAVADGFLRQQRFGRDGAESTTKAYAYAVALFLRWCARTGRCWQVGAEHVALFMTWLAHAGPDASGAETVGSGAVVLAGPGGCAGAVTVADQWCVDRGAGHGGACGRCRAGSSRFGVAVVRGRRRS